MTSYLNTFRNCTSITMPDLSLVKVGSVNYPKSTIYLLKYPRI